MSVGDCSGGGAKQGERASSQPRTKREEEQLSGGAGTGRGQREGDKARQERREREAGTGGRRRDRAAHTSRLGLEKTGKSKMVVRPSLLQAFIFFLILPLSNPP